MRALESCWRCGALPRCPRCGSTERRSGGKGCAECHRRDSRARYALRREALGIKPRKAKKDKAPRDPQDQDVKITPAVREYLARFDEWLRRPSAERETARAAALERLMNDNGPHGAGR